MPALAALADSSTPKARSGAGRRARANTVRRRAGLPADTERSQGLDEEEGWPPVNATEIAWVVISSLGLGGTCHTS